MARPKQPIKLITEKGKTHFTKEQIEKRQNEEIQASSDDIKAPDYLTESQKKEFYRLSNELNYIGIMTNLDCESLANYIVSLSNYIKFTKMVNKISADDIYSLEKAVNMQDKAFKQCRSAASDLGLTISSRCKLVVPKKQEEDTPSKWTKFGDASG